MKTMAAILLMFFTLSTFANDGKMSIEYYNLLTQKIVEDFQVGVKNYNEKKEINQPSISKEAGQHYAMVVKNTRIRFSIVNYLNNQMYVNDKLVNWNTFGQIKTTWKISFIGEAFAAEDELDGQTTKVLLTALGSLTDKLEEVGMMCFSGCRNEIRKNNREKVYATLERQHEECNQQLNVQSDSIKKYPNSKMVSILHSTFNPEFKAVRGFIQKISEGNAKKIKAFMSDKMLVNKNYKSCVEVIASGTAADGLYNSLDKEKSVLDSGARTSIEQEIEKAQRVCVKMEELRSCLVSIKNNLNTINSIKRSDNKDYFYVPVETLPEMKGIER